jgi:hypothetical protein
MIPVVIPVATKVTKSSHVTDEGGSSPEKSAHLAAQNIEIYFLSYNLFDKAISKTEYHMCQLKLI